MTTDMSEFERARLDRETSALQVTPLQLLRAVLYDIENHLINPDGILIIAVQRKDTGVDHLHLDRYRAGLSRMAEIAVLSAAESRAINSWIE